jgi:hypothetical protein
MGTVATFEPAQQRLNAVVAILKPAGAAIVPLFESDITVSLDEYDPEFA